MGKQSRLSRQHRLAKEVGISRIKHGDKNQYVSTSEVFKKLYRKDAWAAPRTKPYTSPDGSTKGGGSGVPQPMLALVPGIMIRDELNQRRDSQELISRTNKVSTRLARKELKNIIKQGNANAGVYNNLGCACAYLGYTGEARDYFAKANVATTRKYTSGGMDAAAKAKENLDKITRR